MLTHECVLTRAHRYVVDTPRCVNPQTFMSNMLQACSILYKTKLPLLLVGCWPAHGSQPI